MSTILLGRSSWSPAQIDAEGHRTYHIKYKVWGETTDGPANALQTPGLPLPGSIWAVDNDLDVYAWCRQETTVTEEVTDEPNRLFHVEKVFSTKPPDSRKGRCNDTPIEDPLLEPDRISGDFATSTSEATHNRFARALTNSSWEQIKGQLVEFEGSRFVITVEQNVPALQLGLLNALKDCLNDAPLWGLPARCLKFKAGPWTRKFYGQCYVYFTRSLTIEANAKQSVDQSGNLLFDLSGNPIIESGWDRNLLDEGDKAINGHWGVLSKGEIEGRWIVDDLNGAAPDRMNPAHFIRVVDSKGAPMHVILDGTGVPVQLNDNDYHVRSVTVNNHGVGYAVDDTITLAGGTFTAAAVLKVTAVLDNPAGQIVGLMGISNPGVYSVKPANAVAQGSSSGAGTGASFDIEWTEPNKGTQPGNVHVEHYKEANLLLLGIPLVLE